MAFLKGDARIDATDHQGCAAVMWAARAGRLDALDALLQAGAWIDATDHEGRTALMWAAHSGHRGVVKALIDGGASLQQQDKKGSTALVLAIRRGRSREIAETLQERYIALGMSLNDAERQALHDYGMTTLHAAASAMASATDTTGALPRCCPP